MRTTYAPMADLLGTPIGWQELALCREVGTELFFVEKNMPVYEAKQVCRMCKVKAECLDFALEHDEEGVWGETSENERRAMKPSTAA